MRAQEFLLEYSRDITKQRLGTQVLNTVRKEGSGRIRRVLGRDLGPQDSNDDTIEALIRMLELADPTANKQYMPWLARTYIKGETFLEDVLTQVREYSGQKFKYEDEDYLLMNEKDVIGILNE